MSSEVSRASQTHQVPHMGLPHRDPVTRARKVYAAPTGALARATASASFMRQIRLIALAVARTA